MIHIFSLTVLFLTFGALDAVLEDSFCAGGHPIHSPVSFLFFRELVADETVFAHVVRSCIFGGGGPFRVH